VHHLSSAGNQKDELESSLADLFTSCEFVEKTLDNGTDTEVKRKNVAKKTIQLDFRSSW